MVKVVFKADGKIRKETCCFSDNPKIAVGMVKGLCANEGIRNVEIISVKREAKA